jgi:pyruvate carboxylase subunit B
MRWIARIGEREMALEAARRAAGRCAVRAGADGPEIEARVDGATVVVRLDGRVIEALVAPRQRAGASGPAYAVTIGGRTYDVRLTDPLRSGSGSAPPRRDGPAEVRATMPGRVVALLAREGEAVKAGQGILVVEAMKMENELPAPRDGRLTAIGVRPGATVETGTLLFRIE